MNILQLHVSVSNLSDPMKMRTKSKSHDILYIACDIKEKWCNDFLKSMCAKIMFGTCPFWPCTKVVKPDVVMTLLSVKTRHGFVFSGDFSQISDFSEEFH